MPHALSSSNLPKQLFAERHLPRTFVWGLRAADEALGQDGDGVIARSRAALRFNLPDNMEYERTGALCPGSKRDFGPSEGYL